jgi:hypothetical protein
MPDHFHLVVWPRGDGDLSESMMDRSTASPYNWRMSG